MYNQNNVTKDQNMLPTVGSCNRSYMLCIVEHRGINHCDVMRYKLLENKHL